MPVAWKYGTGHECFHLGCGLRVLRGLTSGHNRVEAVVIVCRVRNSTDSPVRFDHRIFSLNSIAVSFFPCRFGVAGISVDYSIIKRVLGVRLKKQKLLSFRKKRPIIISP